MEYNPTLKKDKEWPKAGIRGFKKGGYKFKRRSKLPEERNTKEKEELKKDIDRWLVYLSSSLRFPQALCSFADLFVLLCTFLYLFVPSRLFVH